MDKNECLESLLEEQNRRCGAMEMLNTQDTGRTRIQDRACVEWQKWLACHWYAAGLDAVTFDRIGAATANCVHLVPYRYGPHRMYVCKASLFLYGMRLKPDVQAGSIRRRSRMVAHPTTAQRVGNHRGANRHYCCLLRSIRHRYGAYLVSDRRARPYIEDPGSFSAEDEGE